MTTRAQQRVARHLVRLRRYWADLDDHQPRIRNVRVPSASGDHGNGATPSKVAHLDVH